MRNNQEFSSSILPFPQPSLTSIHLYLPFFPFHPHYFSLLTSLLPPLLSPALLSLFAHSSPSPLTPIFPLPTLAPLPLLSLLPLLSFLSFLSLLSLLSLLFLFVQSFSFQGFSIIIMLFILSKCLTYLTLSSSKIQHNAKKVYIGTQKLINKNLKNDAQ